MIRNFAYIPPAIRNVISRFIQGDSVARSKLVDMLRTDFSLLSLFLVRRSIFSYEQRKQLLGCEPPLGRLGMPLEWVYFAKRQIDNANNVFTTISILELLQYSANKLLQDGDVMSMYSGLELRFPLLDVDLIRSTLNTSHRAKVVGGKIGEKQALTTAILDFPIELMDKKKRGFTIPVNNWIIGQDSMKNQSQDTEIWRRVGLNETMVSTIFNLKSHHYKNSNWLKIWQLLALKKWIIK
jgi:hypothetical protein